MAQVARDAGLSRESLLQSPFRRAEPRVRHDPQGNRSAGLRLHAQVSQDRGVAARMLVRPSVRESGEQREAEQEHGDLTRIDQLNSVCSQAHRCLRLTKKWAASASPLCD